MPITPKFLIYNIKLPIHSTMLKLPSIPFIRQYSPIFRQSEKILNVTEPACDQLNILKQKFPEKKLRIAIEAGGCQGFQYKFSLEMQDNENETDPNDM